jgi:hypothetical protein
MRKSFHVAAKSSGCFFKENNTADVRSNNGRPQSITRAVLPLQ